MTSGAFPLFFDRRNYPAAAVIFCCTRAFQWSKNRKPRPKLRG
jgi:hypothetical protein